MIRLAHPADTAIYAHVEMKALETLLDTNAGQVKRVCVVTDGIFSMRGDYAPLNEIAALCKRHEADYEEGIITSVDDSHGVGAFGGSGRATEKTSALVEYLFAHNILVTGLNYPVVPKGAEEIRLQVSASHTDQDIDYVLDTLQRFDA